MCARRELFTEHGAGRGNRRPLRWRRRRRQAERPSDKVGRTAEVLRGAAPHPVKGGYYETEKRYQDHSAANAGTVQEHFGKGGCRADDYRAYVRAAVLRHKVVTVDGLREYTHELKGIGRSLNQLAILTHEGRISTVNLDSTCAALEKNYIGLCTLAGREQR